MLDEGREGREENKKPIIGYRVKLVFSRMTNAREPQQSNMNSQVRQDKGANCSKGWSDLAGNTLEKFLTYQLDGRIGAYHGDHG